MGNQYRDDEDLAFLEYCKEEDMRVLGRYLTHDKDGQKRYNGKLLTDAKFRQYDGQPDQYLKSWQLIAGELQHFGGDTFINLFRGHGVLYKEIVCDVCDKLNLDYNKDKKAYEIENDLLEKLVKDSWEKMTQEQRKAFLDQIGVDATLSTAAGFAAMQAVIRLGGFASYQVALIIANSVAKTIIGTGLTIVGKQAVVRGLSIFAGPIGWAIGTVLSMNALSGPAFRVTIPSVIQVAYMRRALTEKKRF
jgi:uncharacterized protein YaaW (UPF0174 family)